MFSNFISFRDFTLYVIPGNISAYIFLKILFIYGINPFPTFVGSTSSNLGLLFVFASASTCIGFIQSQLILLFFNWLIKTSNKSPMVIQNLKLEKKLEAKILKKIQVVFEADENFAFSNDYFLCCNSFVLTRTNEHSYGYSRRLINFSLFSTVIPIPLILVMTYFLMKINLKIEHIVLTILVISIPTLYYFYRLTLNFRTAWVKNVLFIFLTLNDKENNTK